MNIDSDMVLLSIVNFLLEKQMVFDCSLRMLISTHAWLRQTWLCGLCRVILQGDPCLENSWTYFWGPRDDGWNGACISRIGEKKKAKRLRYQTHTSLCDLTFAVKRLAPDVTGIRTEKPKSKVIVAFNSLTRCIWKWNSAVGGPWVKANN